MRQTTTLIYFLVVLSFSRAESQNAPRRHGTCIAYVQNGSRAAVVVDSQVVTEINGVRISSEMACKVWLQRPTLVAATSGQVEVGTLFKQVWSAQKSARNLLSALPEDFDQVQLQKALTDWGDNLIHALGGYYSGRDGEIATLVVVTRLGGGPPIFGRGRISSVNHRAIRSPIDAQIFPASMHGSGIAYSGSCRNLVGVNGDKSLTQIGLEDEERLNRAAGFARSLNIISAQQLGDAALDLERELSELALKYSANASGIPDIGPPFQVLTLDADTRIWEDRFQKPCGEAKP